MILWTCPSVGFVKLNADAAYDSDSLRATVGDVLHDSLGKFLAIGNNVAGTVWMLLWLKLLPFALV